MLQCDEILGPWSPASGTTTTTPRTSLLDASTCVGNIPEALLDLRISRAELLITNGQELEALGLLQAMLPEAKQFTANPHYYTQTLQLLGDVLLHLDRNQEAHNMATELFAFAKAKFGLEHHLTLRAMSMYALACAKLGHVEEAKANFKDVLTIQTRVLGREHSDTQVTMDNMRFCGFAVPSR